MTVFDKLFADAMDRAIEKEREILQDEIAVLEEHPEFRHSPPDDDVKMLEFAALVRERRVARGAPVTLADAMLDKLLARR